MFAISTLTIIMLVALTIFVILILALSTRLKPLSYFIIGCYTIFFLLFSLVFYERIKGYPTNQKVLDNEPEVVYAMKNEKHVFYWLLEQGKATPRAYKFPRTKEEEEKMRRAIHGIETGKKMTLVREKGKNNSESFFLKEYKVQDLYKK
jgi:hypothetical protein